MIVKRKCVTCKSEFECNPFMNGNIESDCTNYKVNDPCECINCWFTSKRFILSQQDKIEVARKCWYNFPNLDAKIIANCI
jgi:hypothetical protein